MATREATVVDYQRRAREFRVGDVVFHRLSNPNLAGRVVAVYPAIGMVDVQFPHGSTRYPVEDVQLATPEGDSVPPLVGNNSIPGGEAVITKMARRIAVAHVKRALYWAARDRQYRSTRRERDTGCLYCPKHPEAKLIQTTYKRREGQSEKLLGCPACMFLIKRDDVLA